MVVTKPEKMPVLSLQLGVNTFRAIDIIPVAALNYVQGAQSSVQRTGKLPEGMYEICVSFINAETLAPLSSPSCQVFTIANIGPPTLISPPDRAKISLGAFNLGAKSQSNQATSSLQSIPMTISQLLQSAPNEIGSLISFSLQSASTQKYYYVDPKITERDPAEAMQFPIPMTINPGIGSAGGDGASQSLTNSGSITSGQSQDSEAVYAFHFSQLLNSGTPEKGNEPLPTFSWLPPAPSPATPVKYALRIVPVYPGQSANDALQSTLATSRDVIYFGTTSANLLADGLLGVISTNLVSTPHFVWAVRATDVQGNPIGGNNGWSVPRTFDVTDPVPSSPPQFETKEGFFDVFERIEKSPCPYTSKTLVRKVVTPCEKGSRKSYEVWRVFTCSLLQGHPGPHHGTVNEVYILKGTISCNTGDKVPDGMTQEPVPAANKVVAGNTLDNIPAERNTVISATSLYWNPRTGETKSFVKPTDAPTGWINLDSIPPIPGVAPGMMVSWLPGREPRLYVDTTNGKLHWVFPPKLPLAGWTPTVPPSVIIVSTPASISGGIKSGTTTQCPPCPYRYKVAKGHIYVAGGDGNCKKYAVFEVTSCTLCRGHSGDHECVRETFYVLVGTLPCNDHKTDPPPPDHHVTTWVEINKIPAKPFDGKDVTAGGAVTKEPCPATEKKLLRTVAGPWRKVSTEVFSAGLKGKGTWASATVKWERDIWNVYFVKHCTLEKGHGGPHVWNAGGEEWQKAATLKETRDYGVGVAQTPPTDDAGSSIPQEEPPRGAVIMK